LTGFTLTDAADFEDEEGDIPEVVVEKINLHVRLSSVQNLFDKSSG
jgi:hypothetical protein